MKVVGCVRGGVVGHARLSMNISFPKRYVHDPQREDHSSEAPFSKLTAMKSKQGSVYQTVTYLWRMSAVRVRLPPAVFCGC
jgi:hypothetical protein